MLVHVDGGRLCLHIVLALLDASSLLLCSLGLYYPTSDGVDGWAEFWGFSSGKFSSQDYALLHKKIVQIKIELLNM